MKTLKSNKKIKAIILLMSIVVFLSFQLGTVLADSVTSGKTVLEASETIDETGFFSGDKIRVDGKVNGPAFAAGSDINITGVIDGDLFVAGQTINISGTVNGSVIVAGQDITITGDVKNSIYSAGSNVTLKSQNNGSAFLAGQKVVLEEQAKVAGDLFVGAAQVFERGTVGRNFYGSSDNISISGEIGRNANLEVTDLYLESAEIKGNLKYNSANEATISKDSKVLGKTDWKKVEPQPKKAILTKSRIISLLISMLGAILVWFVIKLIRPRFWSNLSANITNSPLKTIGFGALALIVTPTAIFFLLISIVGAPLAFILMCMFGVAIYISKIIVAVFIGSWLRDKFNWTEKHKGVWLVLLGLLILSILSIIHILSLLVMILVIFLGLGSIVNYIIKR